jgi:protein-tyrosine phosphatase
MAEAIFRKLVKEKGMESQIIIDSAGTGDWHIGHPPHQGTRDILTKHQISFEGMKARQVQEGDLTEFDYIIAMDAENVGNLRKMAGFSQTGYVGRLLDFVPEEELSDVPDPYFTGNFDQVYDLVTKGCEKLLEDIMTKHFQA